MKTMQTSGVHSDALRSTREGRRHVAPLVGAVIAGALWLAAGPAFAQSCPAGTGVGVEPAGDGIAGALRPGTGGAVFVAGGVTATCNTSRTAGVIPVDGNPGDPVSGIITPPTFTSCSSSIGLPPNTTTNDNNGDWSLDVTCGNQARLHIPRAGAVVRIFTCTITVAPTAAVDVPATWTNGSPSTLTIDAVVPISRSGFGCPNANTATFRATYDITNTTDPAESITVTEVPVEP